MKLRLFILSILAIILFAPSSFGKTYYVSEALGNDTFDGSSPVVVTDTIGPFRTIVHALDSALDGDTIMVAEGTYRERLVITRQIVLLGVNYTVSGRSPRGAETILQPDMDSIGVPPDDRNTLITLMSGNVILAGFTFTGDNDTLVSGNIVGTADVDVSYGIYINGPLSNVLIANNIIRDFYSSGVETFAFGLAGGMNNLLTENLIDNIGGSAVMLRSDAHLDVIANDLASATFGIHCIEMGDSLSGNLRFEFNNLQTDRGITVTNYSSAMAVGMVGNVIVPQSVSGIYGISIESPSGNAISTASNHISGMQAGIRVLGPDGVTMTMTNDTILSAQTWIGWGSVSTAGDTLNISGLHARGASAYGMNIFNDSSRTVVNMSDASLGTAAGGIRLYGDVQLNPGNTVLSSIGGYYILLDASTSGTVPIVDINALNMVFDGNTGAAMTDIQGMDAEDKIMHYLDDPQFAYVDFKAENIFISLIDGNNSLNRALTRVADNYTIVSRGTYFNESAVIANDLVLRSFAQDSVRILNMNGAGKTLRLESRLNVKDGLVLTDGVINTTAGTMYVGYHTQAQAVNGITGGSVSSYVEGPLYVVNTAQLNGDVVYFPISSDTNYRPVRMHITHLSAGVAYTIRGEVINAPTTGVILSPELTHTSTVRFWSFQSVGFSPISNIEYEAVYSSVKIPDDVEFPASLRLAAYNAGWKNIGGVGSAQFDGSIRSDSAYSIISNIALANLDGGDNRLGIKGVISKFSWVNNCVTDTFMFTSGATTTGDSFVRYFWDFGDTSVADDTSDQMNPSYRFAGPGTYIVSHMAEDNNGSIDTLKLEVVVDPLPVVDFTTFIPCFPNNVSFTDASSITSGSNVSWDWTLDTFTASGSGLSVPFPDTGTYMIKLIVTSDMGCVDSTSRSIYYGDSVRITLSPLGPVNKCIDSVITLSATTNALSYRWVETGDVAYTTDVVDPGVYTFIGSTSANCIASDTVEVIDIPNPIVDAGLDTTIWRGTTVVLQGSASGLLPVADFDWTPDDGSLDDNKIVKPTAKPDKNTMYHLKVTNIIGCIGYDSVFVEVKWPETFVVQNLITPNNDQMNDFWDLSNVPAVNNAKVYVLSRWGKEVYSSDNYLDEPFDGNNVDGEPLPEGTYTYLIIFDLEDLGSIRGNLQIVR